MFFIKKILKLFKCSSHQIFIKGMFYGVFAAIEHEKMLRSIDVEIIIDVGANKGQFSLVSRKFFPNAQIIAFEPLPCASSIYNELFRKDENIKLFVQVVSCVSGVQKLNVTAKNDSSSLLSISNLQTEFFPGTKKVNSITVLSTPLSDVISLKDINAEALLKIDVQGTEMEVLKSTKKLLKSIKYVYIEVSFKKFYINQPLAHDLIDYMTKQGFHIKGVYNCIYSVKGETLQSDFLFINSKML